MLELICQQRYRVAGIPVDISPYRNHGFASGTSVAAGPDGPDAAIGFNGANSVVAVPLGSLGAWRPLTALKVEIDVFVPSPGVSRTLCLIEGDGAFRFDIFEKAITATVFTGGGARTTLRAADAFAPDQRFHPVPPKRWVTLGLYHDGFARTLLTMGGRIVAETLATGSVVGVGPAGVSIGNTLAGDAPLHGSIAETRIWRHDPMDLRREFLGREIDREQAECLAASFDAVWTWIAAHPTEAEAVVALIDRRIAEAVRALLLLPPAEQQHAREVLGKVIALWCQDRIAGKSMRKAQRDWAKVLAKAGVPDTLVADAAAIEERLQGIALPDITISCDPKLERFIALLDKTLGKPRREKA